MIRHHNRSMKLKTSPVITQTVKEHGVPGFRRKGVSIALAKCYEQCSSCFLIVGQLPPVFVLPIKRAVGHRVTRMGRTLLSVAFDFIVQSCDSKNVNRGGQECPPHTGNCTRNLQSCL